MSKDMIAVSRRMFTRVQLTVDVPVDAISKLWPDKPWDDCYDQLAHILKYSLMAELDEQGLPSIGVVHINLGDAQ